MTDLPADPTSRRPAVGELRAIEAAPGPVTRAAIREALGTLGVEPGSVLLVHSSLSRLGWVAGGAHAVLLALLDAVGPAGTLVMPTHSGHLSDPAGWAHPPVPPSWWPVIREHTPPFDSRLTPTRQMGAIVECFRHLPGVTRSSHPRLSFAAAGPRAAEITGAHTLEAGLGEGSPLARLYDAGGLVLLLGVGHINNTSLHLAEHRAEFAGKRWVTEGSPVLVEGQSCWVKYSELETDDSDFGRLGEEFAAGGMQIEGRVAGCTALLMRQRDLVDFAVAWFGGHRGAPTAPA